MPYFAFEDQCDRDVACNALAALLRDRQLALFLGAGVSMGMGLLNWSDLVQRCERAVGIDPAMVAYNTDYPRRMQSVRDNLGGANYIDIVRSGLYPDDYLANAEYPDRILVEKMLIALGALVMASARGSVGDVITMNFDDVLEWYLHLHGFAVQVVTEPATLLSGSADVRIHHFHGFAPLTSIARPSSALVFSYHEYIERLAQDSSAPWPTLLANQLMTKTLVFVGSSMSDTDIDVALSRARNHVLGSRPLGYALLVDPGIDKVQHLKSFGIVPVQLPSFDEVPNFLLEVCRRAAKN